MTQEERQLLLTALCGYLPYKVKCFVEDAEYGDLGTLYSVGPFENVDPNIYIQYYNGNVISFFTSEIKPYLRSISSMTDEEVDKLFKILKVNEDNGKEWIKINDVGIIRLFTEEGKDFYEIANAMDYLNSIHIDYRLLISKGLALEATEDMPKNNNQN